MNNPLSLAPWFLLTIIAAVAEETRPPAPPAASAAPVPISPALAVPKPGVTNDAPYAPQPILQGGIVVALYPPGSPFLNQDHVREPEQYNLSKAVPGRISSIVNIHNPSIEMHIYGNGRHPGDPLSDGSRMSAGLANRNGMPFGTWQDRYIDWFRDLGFLQKPGAETKAARDTAAFLTQPPRTTRTSPRQ